ncbi:hypothetical protein AMS68_004897 [Peltaster fructicola]|uniref:tRNA wybutosine-synthesizing protein 2 n=1 Tax=Peltaster fructicola TaxID=286661 RepID=A0A6H0XY86_9PEZI|nr:hypothetical protein AMS68_004897 [Peltaster fructicola]
MDRAIASWRTTLTDQGNEQIDRLARSLAKTYTRYGSMLLLPSRALQDNGYQDLRQHYDESTIVELHRHIAKEMKVSHIAVNHPIPPARQETTRHDPQNYMRSPINFQPVYGDFGPSTCSSPPSAVDFTQAYWITAKQNGVAQSWAPRWTMFSRGNISEKARVLDLPSVAQAVAEGVRSGSGCAVVDLYAGIGYFAFSYVKAGVHKVLCWELNQWSCEGLRRGAQANRWKSATYSGESLTEMAAGPEQLVIFNETNELALHRIDAMRACLPPIRHVNCGLLPTSRPSYSIALKALDRANGGWIHVHENFGVHEIELRAAEVAALFQSMLDQQIGNTKTAMLESITRVKTYAPGVYHCVLDICISPA